MQDFEGSTVDRVNAKWSHPKSMNHNLSSPGEWYLKEHWDFVGSELLRILQGSNVISGKESFLIFTSWGPNFYSFRNQNLTCKMWGLCQLSVYHCHKELGNLEMRTHLITSVPLCILFLIIFPSFSHSLPFKGNFEKKEEIY